MELVVRILRPDSDSRGGRMRIAHRHPDGRWAELTPTIPIRTERVPPRWRVVYRCECGARIVSEVPV